MPLPAAVSATAYGPVVGGQPPRRRGAPRPGHRRCGFDLDHGHSSGCSASCPKSVRRPWDEHHPRGMKADVHESDTRLLPRGTVPVRVTATGDGANAVTGTATVEVAPRPVARRP